MIKDSNKRKNLAIIDIGSEGTSVYFIKNRILCETVSFPFGGKKLTEAIMKAKNIEFKDAESYKKEHCYANLEEKNKDEFSSQITIPFLLSWKKQFLETINNSKGENKLNSFNSIIFCGGAVQLDMFTI